MKRLALLLLLTSCASGPVGRTNEFYRRFPTKTEIEAYRELAEGATGALNALRAEEIRASETQP